MVCSNNDRLSRNHAFFVLIVHVKPPKRSAENDLLHCTCSRSFLAERLGGFIWSVQAMTKGHETIRALFIVCVYERANPFSGGSL